MISRAALCPGAPLLIPGLADGLRAQVPELVAACDRAVGLLRGADRVLLLSSGPRPRDRAQRSGAAHSRDRRSSPPRVAIVHPAGTRLSSALITGTSGPAHFTGRLAGAPAAGSPAQGLPPSDLPAPDLPALDGPAASPAGVGIVVGAALLARVGITVPVVGVDLVDRTVAPLDRTVALLDRTVDPADRTTEVDRLFDEAQRSADRVGLLIIAEGSASRGAVSPGGGSTDADVLDAALATALAAGDPKALDAAATLEPASATRLLFNAGPALRALAGLTVSRPPEAAELLLAQAPFGVGYLVAAWSWSG